MAEELDFGNTPEHERAIMRSTIRRVHHDLYCSGEEGEGFLEEFKTFIIDFNSRAEERKKMHSENKWRLNALIGMGGLLLAIAGFFLKTFVH